MNKKHSILNVAGVVLSITLLMASGMAHATPPQSINYQAYLTDGAGLPVTGAPAVTFRIYDADVGGVLLWSDTIAASVTNGLFSVELGTLGNPLPIASMNNELWLGIEVGVDGEASPRTALLSTNNAFHSEDSDTLQGQTAASLDQSAHVINTTNPHGVSPIQIGAATPADINTHSSDGSAHHARYLDSEAVTAMLAADGPSSTLDADTIDGLDTADLALITTTYTKSEVDLIVNSAVAALQIQVTALQDLLQHFTRAGDEVYITGANLHLLSGSGTTDGAVNGQGNLIVGYNEAVSNAFAASICSLGQYTTQADCTSNGGTWAVDHKTGSHNIVIGMENNYSRYGGLVVGFRNSVTGNLSSISGGAYGTVTGDSSTISGGVFSTVSGQWASVSGGIQNIASGTQSSVSGGTQNIASGSNSSISGGSNNIASGTNSSVSGGYYNDAIGRTTSISGGQSNLSVANYSSILGGLENLTGDGFCHANNTPTCEAYADNTIGLYSTVSGGKSNRASGDQSSVSGGLFGSSAGLYSSVSGGRYGGAFGQYSSVSGGFNNNADGVYATASGGYENRADGDYSSISGGQSNRVTGIYGSILGGSHNIAGNATCDFNTQTCTLGTGDGGDGARSTISGGVFNVTNAQGSSISGGSGNRTITMGTSTSNKHSSINGGHENTVSRTNASISGGIRNTASGAYSSVSGGQNNSSSGSYSSVSGGVNRSSTGNYDWRAGSLFETQ